MQDETVNVNQSKSVLSVAGAMAVRTLAYSLCLIIMITSVLSLALPSSANVFFSLELYGKALSQSERVLKRRENRLSKFYEGGVEYQAYAKESYLPILKQTTEYSIKLASVKNNPKNMERVIKYIETYWDNQFITGSNYNKVVDTANINSVSNNLKVMVYNNESYLNYHYVLNAYRLGADRVAELGYTSGEDFIRRQVAKHIGELANGGTGIYSTEYLPDYSVSAYVDYLLTEVDFNYTTNLLVVIQSDKLAERNAMFDKSKFSNDSLSLLLVPDGDSYRRTAFYNDIITMYQAIKAVYTDNVYELNQPFYPNTSFEERLKLVYYARVINIYSYVFSCLFGVANVYNGADNLANANVPLGLAARSEFDFWRSEYANSMFSIYNDLLANI